MSQEPAHPSDDLERIVVSIVMLSPEIDQRGAWGFLGWFLRMPDSSFQKRELSVVSRVCRDEMRCSSGIVEIGFPRFGEFLACRVRARSDGLAFFK